jgi:5-methylcytosine-specific restriction protein B
MSNAKTLTWRKIESAAELAFNIYAAQSELKWANQAWEILIEEGLATYSNETELCQVIIHFFALVCFYYNFYNFAWETYLEPNYLEWAEKLELNAFNFRQLINSDPYLIFNKSQNFEEYENDNEYRFDKREINYLVNIAHNRVVAALLKGFGNEGKFWAVPMLFISLWRSSFSDEEYQEYKYYEDYTGNEPAEEIVEIDLISAQKIIIFEWLIEECRSVSVPEIEPLHRYTSNQDFNEYLYSSVKPSIYNQKYTLVQCAKDTEVNETKLKRWIQAINRKGQAIFSGSPGTGKTFIAQKLAQHLISGGDGFSELVQFHPAYSYEDFIQGIRPQSQDGQLKYPLVSGRFLEFCKKAESCEGLCVLIIDEINRANLAQVFGELMYLLEYRDKKICLAGSSELFGIPENVRIIGTMNTADRSIALVDHALRRRFAFIELRPNYDVLRRYHQKKKTDFQVDGLIEILERLNKVIANKHYEIGISYFLTENLAEELEDIWQMEIEPYLEEYFYDQLEKVDEFRWDKIEQQVRL